MKIRKYLYHPKRILIFCVLFAVGSLIFNGGFYSLYSLHRDHNRLNDQMVLLEKQIVEMDQQLRLARDPEYIERQARDRYDLADEQELIFVFADE